MLLNFILCNVTLNLLQIYSLGFIFIFIIMVFSAQNFQFFFLSISLFFISYFFISNVIHLAQSVLRRISKHCAL